MAMFYMQYKGCEKAAKVVEFVAKWLNLCLWTVCTRIGIAFRKPVSPSKISMYPLHIFCIEFFLPKMNFIKFAKIFLGSSQYRKSNFLV